MGADEKAAQCALARCCQDTASRLRNFQALELRLNAVLGTGAGWSLGVPNSRGLPGLMQGWL